MKAAWWLIAEKPRSPNQSHAPGGLRGRSEQDPRRVIKRRMKTVLFPALAVLAAFAMAASLAMAGHGDSQRWPNGDLAGAKRGIASGTNSLLAGSKRGVAATIGA